MLEGRILFVLIVYCIHEPRCFEDKVASCYL